MALPYISTHTGAVIDGGITDLVALVGGGLSKDLVLASGKGLDFSLTADGTTKVSELFADFERGTWVPAITDSSLNAGEGQTFSNQVGWYAKFDSWVFIRFRITLTAITNLTGGDQGFIINLPFTSQNTANNLGHIYFSLGAGLAITANTSITGNIPLNGTRIELYNWDATTGTTALTITELSATGDLYGAGFYEV